MAKKGSKQICEKCSFQMKRYRRESKVYCSSFLTEWFIQTINLVLGFAISSQEQFLPTSVVSKDPDNLFIRETVTSSNFEPKWAITQWRGYTYLVNSSSPVTKALLSLIINQLSSQRFHFWYMYVHFNTFLRGLNQMDSN